MRYSGTDGPYTDMYSHDPAGVVKTKLRVLVPPCCNGCPPVAATAKVKGQWTYNTEGRVTEAKPPDGTQLDYGYGAMERPKTPRKTAANLTITDMVTGTTYGPAGELPTITGTYHSEMRTYNSRSQMTSLEYFCGHGDVKGGRPTADDPGSNQRGVDCEDDVRLCRGTGNRAEHCGTLMFAGRIAPLLLSPSMAGRSARAPVPQTPHGFSSSAGSTSAMR